jgi:hypothetical protein
MALTLTQDDLDAIEALLAASFGTYVGGKAADATISKSYADQIESQELIDGTVRKDKALVLVAPTLAASIQDDAANDDVVLTIDHLPALGGQVAELEILAGNDDAIFGVDGSNIIVADNALLAAGSYTLTLAVRHKKNDVTVVEASTSLEITVTAS